MNQRVSVATIVGEAGRIIAALFERWTSERTPDAEDSTLFEPEQWPLSSRKEMAEIASAICKHANELPVVFYNEYADTWSSGFDFLQAYPSEGAQPLYEVGFESSELFGYRLPDDELLEKHVKQLLRRKKLTVEFMWYVRTLQEAIRASSLVPDALIVTFRRVLGGCVEDSQIKQSSLIVPDWLTQYKQ